MNLFNGTINRYLIRALLEGTAMVLAVLMAVIFFVNFLSQLDDIGKGGFGLLRVIAYAGLQLPQITYEILPIAALLGTLIGWGNLANTRELIAMRAVGFSLPRLSASAVMAGIVLILGGILLGEYVAPRSAALAQDLKASAVGGEKTGKVRGTTWVRDGMRFIQLEKIHEKGLLTGVTIHEFQPDGQLVFSGRAEQARIESGGWRLLEFVQSRFLADQIQVIHEAERFWPTQISTDLVDLFAITPDMLTTVELHEHIEFFRGNGLQSVDYEVMFWRRVSLPATLLVMILLAVPFVFGPLRQVGAWQRMAGGIAVGLAYYLLAASFSSAGKLWALGPAWSALLPTLLVAVAASWGIRRIR